MNNKDDTVRGCIKKALGDIIQYSTENAVGDIIWYSVEISVWRQVRDEAGNPVRNPVRRSVSDYFKQNE
jgi:hypothetical protein